MMLTARMSVVNLAHSAIRRRADYPPIRPAGIDRTLTHMRHDATRTAVGKWYDL